MVPREQRGSKDHWDQLETTANKAQLVPLETEAQLDRWACPDQRASQVMLERPERLEV